MDQAVTGARERPPALNAASELGEVVEDVVLVDVSMRPRVEVHHACSWGVVDHVRDIRALSTGEDVAADAARAKRSTELAHVDVHAARLPAAERRQRAGVSAQDRDSQRHLFPAETK